MDIKELAQSWRRESYSTIQHNDPAESYHECADQLEAWVDQNLPKLRIKKLEDKHELIESQLMSHDAVNAFWDVWKRVGEPHKHGVYESTWMAFRAAFATTGRTQLAAVSKLKEADAKVKELEDEVRDLNEVLDDTRRLTKKLDVACFGKGAAEQASLCDLVSIIPGHIKALEAKLETVTNNACEMLGSGLCEKHSQEAKTMSFNAFHKRVTLKCDFCVEDTLERVRQALDDHTAS